MLITRCRQLPDGEELVWAEEASVSQDGHDPRESAISRRGLALSLTSGRRPPRPSSELLPPPPASVVGRVRLKVEWR